jgi:hypothetical protein
MPTPLRTWSPRAGRRSGTVAEGWWWLAGGKVLPTSSWGSPGGRRARRGLAGITEGGGVMTGRRVWLGTVAFQWRVAPATIDECGEVLQLEGDTGVRKWWLMEEIGGSRGHSPMNGGRWRSEGGIPCGPVSSGRWRWTGGGEGCRASPCGRGREDKIGKRKGAQWRRRPF